MTDRDDVRDVLRAVADGVRRHHERRAQRRQLAVLLSVSAVLVGGAIALAGERIDGSREAAEPPGDSAPASSVPSAAGDDLPPPDSPVAIDPQTGAVVDVDPPVVAIDPVTGATVEIRPARPTATGDDGPAPPPASPAPQPPGGAPAPPEPPRLVIERLRSETDGQPLFSTETWRENNEIVATSGLLLGANIRNTSPLFANGYGIRLVLDQPGQRVEKTAVFDSIRPRTRAGAAFGGFDSLKFAVPSRITFTLIDPSGAPLERQVYKVVFTLGRPCWRRVIEDWMPDRTIETTYPVWCYSSAAQHAPREVKRGTTFLQDVRRARARAAEACRKARGLQSPICRP